jgi:hypothetical protein
MTTRIKRLHDKFITGTISREERQELYSHYSPMLFKDGFFSETIMQEFLYASHQSYGKPDKLGVIKII